jgi:predicted transcriptional regulator YheO
MIRDQFCTFFQAEKTVDVFEDVLKNNGIKIAPGSELERLCLNLTDLLEKHLKPELRDEEKDIRPYFRECLGLTDLMTKIIKSSKHDNFASLIPYLKKINKHNAIQNSKTSVLDQYNNKLFELYIATLCLNIDGAALTIDDPDHSAGDNPDILVQINDRTWGFGCKTLHSEKPMTIFENIEKAVSQIENSIADIGVPVINLKNILKHNEYWTELTESGSSIKKFEAFTNTEAPASMICSFCGKIQNRVVNHVGLDNVTKVFEDKKSLPAALLYCSTVTSISINNQPCPTRLNTFHLLTFGKIENSSLSVFEKLNHELQIT